MTGRKKALLATTILAGGGLLAVGLELASWAKFKHIDLPSNNEEAVNAIPPGTRLTPQQFDSVYGQDYNRFAGPNYLDAFKAAYPPLPAIQLDPKEGVVLVLDYPHQHGHNGAAIIDGMLGALVPKADVAVRYYTYTTYHQDFGVSDAGNRFDPQPAFQAIINDPGILCVASAIIATEQDPYGRFFKTLSVPVIKPSGNEGEDKFKVIDKGTINFTHPLLITTGLANRDGLPSKVTTHISPDVTTIEPPPAPFQWRGTIFRDAYDDKGFNHTTSAAVFALTAQVAALHYRYGNYLTPEHIEFALLATANKPDMVSETGEKINYNLGRFGPGFAHDNSPHITGLGVVDIYAADKLCAAMLKALEKEHITQRSWKITKPWTQDRAEAFKEHNKNKHGMNEYTISGTDGMIFQQQFSFVMAELVDIKDIKVSVISSAGKEVELVLTPMSSRNLVGEMTTYHDATKAFIGERMPGKWKIISSHPIQEMLMQTRSLEHNDIATRFAGTGLLKDVLDAPFPELNPNELPRLQPAENEQGAHVKFIMEQAEKAGRVR